jgi:phosphinothricin acetyltransferase
MNHLVVRSGSPADLESINRIYNHYIENTTFTFDIESWPLAKRQDWFRHYHETGRHRLLVAATDEGVAGYVTSSQLRPKAAYDTSVETSIYLAPQHTGKGVGRVLYHALFEILAAEDVHRAYAGITLPNPASIKLHTAFEFSPIGLYHEVGRKFGSYHSVQWFEKKLI